MAYNSDEEEMVPEGLVEVAQANVEFHVPGICFRPRQAGANSNTEYGLVEVKRAEGREETRPTPQSILNRSRHTDLAVGRANIVDSFVMRSTFHWKIVVPTDSTTWRANSCGDQRRTSSGKEVSWISLAFKPMTLGWKTLSRNGHVWR